MNLRASIELGRCSTNWRDTIPVLAGSLVTLRELQIEDAPSLLALLTTAEVTRFISPPPSTVEGFERFIGWARRERQRGTHVCFAVVPHGMTTAVGLFQVRRLDLRFDIAEWGFALGSTFWGTGMFAEGAQLTVDFSFNVVGVTRLEARAAAANGRGNGALRKIGAVKEAMLRRSFEYNRQYVDQVLWSIVQGEWLQARTPGGSRVRIH